MMDAPKFGDRSTCSMCQQPIRFDGAWRHLGERGAYHPATPTTLPDGTAAVGRALLGPLPLRLAYAGASTVESADGVIVAECRTAEIAAALVNAVNGARE